MTPLLLDTHVLIWIMEGMLRVPEQVRAEVERAGDADSLLISAITPWEIALLVSKGRLHLSRDVVEWMEVALALPGIRLQPLSPAIAIASTRLPWEVHPDPADRILLATARHLGATLVTSDRLLLDYAAQGHVKCLAAG
jgi:PIN domain nuclease of toxin-antitoxin system